MREDTITSDIADELRCLATRAWNVGCNKDITFEQFQENYQVLGNVAGFEKGSELPDSGEFQSAESLGKVTLKYVSDTGKVLKNDVVKYALLATNTALLQTRFMVISWFPKEPFPALIPKKATSIPLPIRWTAIRTL